MDTITQDTTRNVPRKLEPVSMNESGHMDVGQIMNHISYHAMR